MPSYIKGREQFMKYGNVIRIGNIDEKYISDILKRIEENKRHVQCYFYNPTKGPFMFVKLKNVMHAKYCVENLNGIKIGKTKITVSPTTKRNLKSNVNGTIGARHVYITFYEESVHVDEYYIKAKLIDNFSDLKFVDTVKGNNYKFKMTFNSHNQCLLFLSLFNCRPFFDKGNVTVSFNVS